MSPLPCRVNTLFTLQKTVVHVPIVQISNTCVPPHIYSGTHNNCDRICKKGSYTRIQFSTLRMCNSASVGPTALKFGGRPFLSLY